MDKSGTVVENIHENSGKLMAGSTVENGFKHVGNQVTKFRNVVLKRNAFTFGTILGLCTIPHYALPHVSNVLAKLPLELNKPALAVSAGAFLVAGFIKVSESLIKKSFNSQRKVNDFFYYLATGPGIEGDDEHKVITDSKLTLDDSLSDYAQAIRDTCENTAVGIILVSSSSSNIAAPDLRTKLICAGLIIAGGVFLESGYSAGKKVASKRKEIDQFLKKWRTVSVAKSVAKYQAYSKS